MESIAISLLWSIANNIHEESLRHWIQRQYPAIYVSASNEVAPFGGVKDLAKRRIDTPLAYETDLAVARRAIVDISGHISDVPRDAGFTVVDGRLAREVTLAFKGTALSDLCDHLRRKTGIRLVAGASVADEKITIFCRKQPLHDVMRQLSRPFGYTWLRSGTPGQYRYELAQDLRSQLLEEELREHHKIHDLFEVIVNSARVGFAKPDARTCSASAGASAGSRNSRARSNLYNGRWPWYALAGMITKRRGELNAGSAPTAVMSLPPCRR